MKYIRYYSIDSPVNNSFSNRWSSYLASQNLLSKVNMAIKIVPDSTKFGP